MFVKGARSLKICQGISNILLKIAESTPYETISLKSKKFFNGYHVSLTNRTEFIATT